MVWGLVTQGDRRHPWVTMEDMERSWEGNRQEGRGLQMEGIGCKCQTFFFFLNSFLRGKRKQTSDILFPLLYTNLKRSFSKILCCHNDTWFHLNLTFLQFWASQCIFLTEMFVLRYVTVLCICPCLCLQIGFPTGSELTWQTSMLFSYIVRLIYVNKTICMVICLSSRFKSIILWPRMTYLVPRLSQNAPCGWEAWCHSLSFEIFLSFINRLLVTI